MLQRALRAVSRRPYRTAAYIATAGVCTYGASSIAFTGGHGPHTATKLNPKGFENFRVSEVIQTTHDSVVLKVAMPDQEDTDVASFCVFKADGVKDAKGKPVIRPYTPCVGATDSDGNLHFCVKGYPTGGMSKHVCSLKAGDTIQIKGPIPKFPYKPNTTDNMVLIAGGTGITPMFQLAVRALYNDLDTTKVTVLNCNHTADDILMEDYLRVINEHPDGKVVHVLSSLPDGEISSGSVVQGRISKDIIQENLPEDSFVFVCGPGSFYQSVCGPKGKNWTQGSVGGMLGELGLTNKQVHKL